MSLHSNGNDDEDLKRKSAFENNEDEDERLNQVLLGGGGNSEDNKSKENENEEEEEEKNEEEEEIVLKPDPISDVSPLYNRDHHHTAVIRVTHRKKTGFTVKRTQKYLKDRSRRILSRKFLLEKFPWLSYAHNYNLGCLTGDLVAGLTTALTLIPISIGFAPLAGLPLQYGLYAAMMPGFVYAIFGNCPEASTAIGPTAVLSLMSFDYAGDNPIYAITLNFFCGLFVILGGIFNLGFLVHYISSPVISGFTSAVCIQVATSQVKGLLGLSHISGRGFLPTWKVVFRNIHSVRPCDAAVGFSTIGILLFLRSLRDFRCCEGTDSETRRARFFRKLKWFIAISRNCILLVLTSFVAYILVDVYSMKDALVLTGDVPAGIPSLQLPWQFNTNQTEVGPFEIAESLGPGLLMIPLVSYLQMVAIVNFYALSSPGRNVDASQEMIALGTCQLLGSFVGSLPVTASISRSAVNSASGVRTTFAGIVTGSVTMISCAFLTPLIGYIPKSAIAAVIISAIIFTIDVEILLPLWKAKKVDLIPYGLTFFLGLFVRVELGLMAGILAHLTILLYHASSPKIIIQNRKIENTSYLLVKPDRSLYFPAVDTIRSAIDEFRRSLQLSRRSSSASNVIVVDEDVIIPKYSRQTTTEIPLSIILDLSNVVEIDFTAARTIRTLAKTMKKNGQNVYFCGTKDEIEDVLQGVDPALFLSYSTFEEAEQRVRGS